MLHVKAFLLAITKEVVVFIQAARIIEEILIIIIAVSVVVWCFLLL